MSDSEDELDTVGTSIMSRDFNNNSIYHMSTPNAVTGVFTSFNTELVKTTVGSTYIDERLFEPQPDMSPVEASWIAVLMMHASRSNGWMHLDFGSFIHDHKLDRHFRKEED